MRGVPDASPMASIEAGHSRSGLDEQGKKEVLRTLKTMSVGFDEGRRLVIKEKFGKARVGADGSPTDPKYVGSS